MGLMGFIWLIGHKGLIGLIRITGFIGFERKNFKAPMKKIWLKGFTGCIGFERWVEMQSYKKIGLRGFSVYRVWKKIQNFEVPMKSTWLSGFTRFENNIKYHTYNIENVVDRVCEELQIN